MPHARRAIDALRDKGHIGDDAYRQIEQELDWLELSTREQIHQNQATVEAVDTPIVA